MVLFPATKEIPDAPNNPSNDQPIMEINNNSMIDIWDVDHVGFNKNNGGYHTVIHGVSQGTWDPVARTGAPAPTAGFGETFILDYTPNTTGGTPDQQLFYRTGAGVGTAGISQLTGLNAQTDGWAYMGGMLVQWGSVTGPGDFSTGTVNGTVTFKDRVSGAIPFPQSLFTVVCTPTYGAPAPDGGVAGSVGVRAFSNTQFQYAFRSNSSRYTGFRWIAIGF